MKKDRNPVLNVMLCFYCWSKTWWIPWEIKWPQRKMSGQEALGGVGTYPSGTWSQEVTFQPVCPMQGSTVPPAPKGQLLHPKLQTDRDRCEVEEETRRKTETWLSLWGPYNVLLPWIHWVYHGEGAPEWIWRNLFNFIYSEVSRCIRYY